MVNPGAFQGSRKAFLLSEKKYYASGVEGGFAAEALAQIQRRYFKRYPIELPHDQEPSPEALAAVDDDAPDPEPKVIDKLKLSEKEYKERDGKRVHRQYTVDYHKAQIKRWMAYQYMKDHNLDPKDSGAQNPYASLLFKLTGRDPNRPRLKTPVNIWRKNQRVTIDNKVKVIAAANGIDKKGLAALRDKVARKMYGSLSEEEKREWQQQSQFEHRQAMEAWSKEMEGPPSTDPVERQKYIQGLVRFTQPILNLMCEATGWKATLMIGGPEPAHDGRLNIISVHSGSTPGDSPMNFGQFERANFKKYFLPAFGSFLQKCYSPEECRSRALPKNKPYIPFEGHGYDLLKLDSECCSVDDLLNTNYTGQLGEKVPKAVPSIPTSTPTLSNSQLQPRAKPRPRPKAPQVPPTTTVPSSDETPRSNPTTPSIPLTAPPDCPPAKLQPVTSKELTPAVEELDNAVRLLDELSDFGDVTPSLDPLHPDSPSTITDDDEIEKLLSDLLGPDTCDNDNVIIATGSPPISTTGLFDNNGDKFDEKSPPPSPPLPASPLISRPTSPSLCPSPASVGQEECPDPPSLSTIPSKPPHRPDKGSNMSKKRARDEDSGYDTASSPARSSNSSQRNDGSFDDEEDLPLKRRRRLSHTRPISKSSTTSDSTRASSPITRRRNPMGWMVSSKTRSSGRSTTLGKTIVSPPLSPTPVKSPDGCPAWFASGLKMFQSEQFGSEWQKLLEAWASFENLAEYRDTTGTRPLSAHHRPEAISSWIKRKRSGKWRPSINDLDEFLRQFGDWYQSIQPAWRVSNEGIIFDNIHGNWEELGKQGGINGVMSVLAGLFFMGIAVRGSGKHRLAWREFVDNFTIVLRKLI